MVRAPAQRENTVMLIKSSAQPVTRVKASPKAVANQTVWEAAKAGAIAALQSSIADCEGLIKDGPLPKAVPSPCWSRKNPLKSEEAEMILEVGIKSGTTWVPDLFGPGQDKARFEPAGALQWMKDALSAVEGLTGPGDGELAQKLHGAVLEARMNSNNARNNGKRPPKNPKRYNPASDKFE